MCLVGMGSNQDFIFGEFPFRKLQSNFVRCFGCNVFLRREGLHQMIEHSAVDFSVSHFCREHFAVCAFGNTVHAADQFLIAVHGFALALTVGENKGKSCL